MNSAFAQVSDFESARSATPTLDLPFAFANANGLIIRQLDKSKLTIVLRQDANPIVLLEISRFLRLPIQLEFADAAYFKFHLAEHYRNDSDTQRDDETQSSSEINDIKRHPGKKASVVDDACCIEAEKIVELIDAMISEAIVQDVSDIHIEVHGSQLILRTRKDGKLRECFRLSSDSCFSVIAQLKARSQIIPTGLNAPQNGKIEMVVSGRTLEIMVATMQSKRGERMVMRLPYDIKAMPILDLPGMSPENQMRLRQVLSKRGGIVVVAGPKGSGKTTTINAILEQLNDGNRNIMAAENVQIHNVDNVNQGQAGEKNQPSFADALRTVLQQDPDVVMMNTLPDRKSMDIALNTAVTGRLIVLALDCDDAIGAITFLRDLKVDRVQLGTNLLAVIAQRLVRRLCGACRVLAQASGSGASRLGFDRGTGVFEPEGCVECDHSGYNGQIGVFEIVCVDDTMRRLIYSGGDQAVMSSYAFMNNSNLSSAARKLVIAGETTVEEAIRIAHRH
jgi:general secretion pathway protein E